jgi:hypothetical protein
MHIFLNVMVKAYILCLVSDIILPFNQAHKTTM